jgi:arylsulfatase A-like enzyme
VELKSSLTDKKNRRPARRVPHCGSRTVAGLPAAIPAALIALGALACITACGGDDTQADGVTARPNVILLSLDTLRADHLGCYGYGRSTSPEIDRFAAGATLYTRAFASAPWTLPSHASMFTGKHPFEHGARTFASIEKVDDNAGPLAAEHFTLAEAFRKAGYRTAAFAANEAFLAKRYRLDQGFEIYEVEHAHAREMNGRVMRWLSEHGEESFFLFVNYMDVHQPFNLEPREGFMEEAARIEDPVKFARSLRRKVLPGDGPLPVEDLQLLQDMYDLALANMDEEIGKLLDHLERTGLLERSILVIVSDHGGYFGEHHLLGHSKDVYHGAMWVPLIVREPGQREGRTRDDHFTSADVPRIIVSLLPEALREELAPLFPDRQSTLGAFGENYYTRPKDLFDKPWSARFDRVRRMLIRWPYKVINSSDGDHELYNLEEDPGEERNLIKDEERIAAALLERIDAIMAAGGTGARKDELPPLTREQIDKLRALGYVDD